MRSNLKYGNTWLGNGSESINGHKRSEKGKTVNVLNCVMYIYQHFMIKLISVYRKHVSLNIKK